jgi:hypothetical protein
MRLLCRVVETILSCRVKDVVVEADDIVTIQRMRNFIHDEAVQMIGWQADVNRENFHFDVIVLNTAVASDEVLDSIVVESSTDEKGAREHD